MDLESLPPAQLATLLAIAEHGSFDAAARALHVTPSAVSQRVRALESAVGQVLIRRGSPCQPTAAGEVLVRLARQTRLVLAEARAALGGGDDGLIELSVAVNADSLATWFRPVVGEVAGWGGVALRLHVEDQAYSAGLLRAGAALAAVTSDPVPVQGCRVEALGTLRYRPAASPAFAARWRRSRGAAGGALDDGGDYDWARMPVLEFNEKDGLQRDLLRQRGLPEPPVVHRVPTTADFREAIRLGLGWGMLPLAQLEPDVAAGRVVALMAAHLDVPLYWQRWRLDSPLLDRLTDAVHAAARAGLVR
ncbi:MAG: LysR family transcriptional regulator ArgP [Frankia sp.]|nr:LysR family transcriptional regulator ArgP [Frankia sp.]